MTVQEKKLTENMFEVRDNLKKKYEGHLQYYKELISQWQKLIKQNIEDKFADNEIQCALKMIDELRYALVEKDEIVNATQHIIAAYAELVEPSK